MFHVLDEAEVDFPFRGMVELEDPESHRRLALDADAFRRDYLTEVESLRDLYRRECSQARIDYVPLDTSMQFDRALTEYLVRRADERKRMTSGANAVRLTRDLLPSPATHDLLHFSLLAGSALVAVPIILHLVMRRRPRLLEFPALRFIQKRHDANQRRLRLRHLLLLLLRMAAIALLALALARPSIKPSMRFGGVLGSQESPVAAALVFDAAPRMEYRHQNKTRMDAARELGLWLLAQLPRESQIAVFDTRLGHPQFEADRGVAKQRIERLEIVTNSQPLAQTVEQAVRLLGQSELERKEVYVFSDFSRAAWPSDAAAALQDALSAVPGAAVYLIDVGVQNPVNYSLGEVRLSRQVLSNRGTLDVQSDVSCTGPGGQRTVELRLEDTNRQQTVTLRPGESQPVEFRLEGLKTGVHQGALRIMGEDGLAADDVRFFTVEVKPAWPVLVVAPKPTHTRALFLTEALRARAFASVAGHASIAMR